jgi:tRNA pseudouridine13 synthase
MDYERALQLPCAHGLPVGRGTLRSTPEDFIVREWLGFEADGDGDHWLLTVRKRDANTHWVAKQIAKLADIHPRDVGYAGLKDRNAITEQSLTVPFRSALGTSWEGVSGDGFDVIKAQRHRRKLKRGALRGNDFEIIVRDFTGDADAVRERITKIATAGVPNYFGPQRFGHELSNLRRAVDMFGGAQVQDRFERGFALSAARAAIFNAVLARRVSERNWHHFIEGDVANLNGSNSIFSVEQIDDLLIDRCTALDIHPTGPLWGKGDLRTNKAAGALEREIASELQVLCDGLASASLEQERRSLRVSVQSLEHALDGSVLTLRFRLGRGAFATTVLHELIENAFENSVPESED